MTTPPFPPDTPISVIVPSEFNHLSEAERISLRNISHILSEARPGLERELGAPIHITPDDPQTGSRWLIGPTACNPLLASLRTAPALEPELLLDRERRLLISDAPTAEGIWETFSWLRSLARLENGRLTLGDCATVDEAIERIVNEVGDSYPSFDLRGSDWQQVCQQHIDKIRTADDIPAAMQRWIAELHDGHTWVRPVPPLGDLPYELWIEGDQAIFTAIPQDSGAWQAGVRPGDRLLGQPAHDWWLRTAATPHSRALVAGRRLLQAPIGSERTLTAAPAAGKQVTWSETIPPPFQQVATWRNLPSGTGYLKIFAWVKGDAIETVVDEAFAAFRAAPGIIIDLRGNPGGDLAIAQRFRDRFLREAGLMGTIRYSTGYRTLTPHEPISGEPAPFEKRWHKPVRFLTDPLTYSASEDALLGLQGLPHVQVIGEPSGGGSGRLRWLRLLPGWRLSISTALTYDRTGRCIEGSGIPVDLPVTPDRFKSKGDDSVLQAADRGW